MYYMLSLAGIVLGLAIVSVAKGSAKYFFHLKLYQIAQEHDVGKY